MLALWTTCIMHGCTKQTPALQHTVSGEHATARMQQDEALSKYAVSAQTCVQGGRRSSGS